MKIQKVKTGEREREENIRLSVLVILVCLQKEKIGGSKIFDRCKRKRMGIKCVENVWGLIKEGLLLVCRCNMQVITCGGRQKNADYLV